MQKMLDNLKRGVAIYGTENWRRNLTEILTSFSSHHHHIDTIISNWTTNILEGVPLLRNNKIVDLGKTGLPDIRASHWMRGW